ncbi:hypothetical protein P7C70_g605, partial [Phenoliferia sp. Uapishka_3]
MTFQITNWTPTTDPYTFNPCTSTLFLWEGGVAPFRLGYTYGNLTGQCSSTVATEGAWWPIDSITGYGDTNTTEWSSITFFVTDSAGKSTPSLVRPVLYSSDPEIYPCVNAPGVFSVLTKNDQAACEAVVGLSAQSSASGDSDALTQTSMSLSRVASTTAASASSTVVASSGGTRFGDKRPVLFAVSQLLQISPLLCIYQVKWRTGHFTSRDVATNSDVIANIDDERAMSHPTAVALGSALATWAKFAQEIGTNAVFTSLKLLTAEPLHKTHTLLVNLQWNRSESDPSTCFNVLEAIVMSHSSLHSHLRDTGIIPRDYDLAATLTQDGLNNFRGMVNAPSDSIRCLVAWVVISSTPGDSVRRAQFCPFAFTPKLRANTPDWEWQELNDRNWETRLRTLAKLSEIKLEAPFEVPRDLVLLGIRITGGGMDGRMTSREKALAEPAFLEQIALVVSRHLA